MTKNVLFVIAHPDDECMFFTPTILHYRYQLNYNISVVCLSNGNAAGLGLIREEELVKSCESLGIPKENVYFEETGKFEDGMKITWDTEEVKDVISEFVDKTSADIIISFDENGISSHPNHISIFKGLELYMKLIKSPNSNNNNNNNKTRKNVNNDHNYNNNNNSNKKNIKAYKLETVNIIRKYIGISDIPLTKCLSYDKNTTQTFISTQFLPPQSYIPMTKHKSQFVWFRYLFVFLSRYSFINTLIEIN
ncbi:hypothetical protein DICPUDRAFT_92416 [Dictyostelium purpureum]|uniref:N-acetylglucosaminylphosphatidylinositol deacetylase n=1 Tax=Dictyostelium purpureum TaxID=5786 RepID=F0ZRJ5_DICPU|nr:uncharacterized protein DICPUDRAFT_92416 [Dictyostelium purpureum]EGC33430.1 hypothetical protein DICPUDRAFT_92416 [Dictyostelium purpureum]|eukprot:XP_003290049.1 hypothetical protein DICPUDRAFT_92416 [Dictyostelium purpureum]